MERRRIFRRNERGAIMIQTALSILMLMGFTVFVCDYGVVLVSRAQAQNAADAGALAGAIARGYDDFDDPPSSSGLAHDTAELVAEANLVWQQAGAAVVTFDCPSGVTGKCVKVDVHRDGNNGSTALPTLFGPILGITSQRVMASATSIVGSGNATNCLRSIALPNEWVDFRAPSNEFNSYDATGNPLSGSRETSFRSPAQRCRAEGRFRTTSDYSSPTNSTSQRLSPSTPITPGLFVRGHPARDRGQFRPKLETCSGQMVQLGQTLPVANPASG